MNGKFNVKRDRNIEKEEEELINKLPEFEKNLLKDYPEEPRKVILEKLQEGFIIKEASYYHFYLVKKGKTVFVEREDEEKKIQELLYESLFMKDSDFFSLVKRYEEGYEGRSLNLLITGSTLAVTK